MNIHTGYARPVDLGGKWGHGRTFRNEGKPVVCPCQITYASLRKLWPQSAVDFKLRVFGMLDTYTYFDESSDRDNRMMVVCGLFARGASIAKLERAWVRMLNKENARLVKEGRKPLSRYHASEMNALDKEFKGWEADESKEFGKKLLRVIRNAEVYVIAHAVVLKDFVKVFPDTKSDPKGCAYEWAMMKCLLNIGNYFGPDIPKDKRATQGISLIFDRSIEYKPRAHAAYDRVKEDEKYEFRDCFNTITEGNNLTNVALQPADLLAYEVMRESSRAIFKSSADMRKFFGKMVKGAKVKVHATYSDERYFREVKQAKVLRRHKLAGG